VDSGVWIIRKNHWYNEIIRQRLDADKPKPPVKREPLQHWTSAEKQGVMDLVKASIINNRRDITNKDVSFIFPALII
jgi:hypothetical protein